MRIFSFLLVAVLAIAAPLNSAPPEPEPISFSVSFEALQSSAVTVRTADGSGSGVVILQTNGNAWVLTAAHVTGTNKADVTLIKQVVVNGRTVGQFSVAAEVVAVSEAQDLAVLRPRSNYFFKSGAKFEAAGYVPKLGEPVVHIGSLRGLPGAESITTGVVSFAGRVMEDLVYDQISAPALPGSSGGPVFNAAGRCIGIVVSGYSDVFSFIVPTRRLAEWAAEQKHPEWLGDFP